MPHEQDTAIQPAIRISSNATPLKAVLIRAFFITLAVFPFGVATALGLVYYSGAVDWQKYLAPSFAHRTLAAAACALLMAIGFALAMTIRQRQTKCRIPTFALLLTLIALTLIPRIIYLYAVGQYIEPTSDCHLAYSHALGEEDHSVWYQSTPSWGYYARYLQALFAFLPDSYIALQLSNVVLDGLVALAIYQLAWTISGSRPVSFTSAGLYAIMPTRIVDGMILTPEIPANLLFVIALTLLATAFRRKNTKQTIALLALSGAALGIAHTFKPISPIFIIAAGVTLVFYSQTTDAPPHMRQLKILGRLGTTFRRALSGLLVLVILVMCCSITKALCINDLEDWLGKEVHGDPAARFLFVGMRTDSEGQVHLGEGHRLSQNLFRDPNVNYEAANELLFSLLATDLTENADKIPALLCKKIQWAWQDDAVDFYYSEAAVGKSSALGTFASLSQCAYIALMAFACFGAVSLFRQKRLPCAGILLIAAIIFGFALLLLISEAQSRYKVMVMPYVCILAAIGIYRLYQTATRLLRRRR